nr:RecName: Full=Atrochrysone carboxylic acid synthase; Short=ACAS; AltName: Full=Cladofulvin biosynthesis cluster protein G; AltName: Full=Non-reducing polyketide synthase claG [Fulvia fulva]
MTTNHLENKVHAATESLFYFSNEFPKRDLQDLFRQAHTRSKLAQHKCLAQFIQDATQTVKQEIQGLSMKLQHLFKPLESVLTWAEDHELREGALSGAIDGVLLIVAQMTTLIGYLENNTAKMDDIATASLAGLGVGLLTACAVSSASTIADLSATGADAVRTAFRLGVHVYYVSQTLEALDPSARPETWAYVINNVTPTEAQEQLDTLYANSTQPATSKVFISALSRSSVTVSGPPARLKALVTGSEFFRTSRYIALPVYGGLCHAPHVYGQDDVDMVMQSRAFSVQKAPATHLKSVWSTSSGYPYLVEDSKSLFASVVAELLTKAICWDSVVSSIVKYTGLTDASEMIIYNYGNSIPLNELESALKSSPAKLKVVNSNLLSWMGHNSPTSVKPRNTLQSKLAIVGMSCRLPGGATSNELFWDVLRRGVDTSQVIPADRFDVATHYDPAGKQLNKSMTQYGCFIDEPGLFDAPFFNMSPREAQTVDPQMRLALVTAYEALEQAGYVANRTASTRLERIGTYYGQAADDYREVNQGQEVSTYYIPGGCRAFGPGRINYFFKFAGPSYSIDTACSSGLAAVEVACQALWRGDVDTAVTGGVNILTNPDGFTGLCSGHFLSKGHNACKTWDATADGYCRADGVGSLVIKRLEDAEDDNDNILGVILGAGTNHSAQAVSITHPHAGHQAYLARQVLRQAGVDPLDVSYVELHGTGTQAGDSEEMQGILDVYAPLSKRRSQSQPLHIGAVKANMGHSESSAGTTALVKVLLMLQNNVIPPHIGITTEMNPKFGHDFKKRNLHIPFELTPWEHTDDKRRIAVVNNFGAAGGNTTMILEDAPMRSISQSDTRKTHVVVLSAKTKTSLVANVDRLISYIDSHPDTQIANVSYTTTARRYQHVLRVAISTSEIAHLQKQLYSHREKIEYIQPVRKAEPPPVAFSFTGQGASHKSMNLELYRDVPTFREFVHQLDSLTRAQGFESFICALDGSHDKDHQHSPVVTQLALVCSEIALAKYWASIGVLPNIVIGHSLGEYAAMHIAGVISASDAIFLVGRRAQLLQERCKIGSHLMMAVRASVDQITQSAAGKPFTVACVNGPADTVLAGTKEEIEVIKTPLESSGLQCIKLDVAFAFHSEQTDPLLDDFEALAKSGVIFAEPKLPVISPLLGKVIFDAKTINATYVRRATREAVDFLAALNNAQEIGAIGGDTVWVEIGPHPVCTGFVRSTIPSVKLALPSFRRGEENWKTLSDSIAQLYTVGVDIDWTELHRPFEKNLRLLDLPTYAFNEKTYWLQYKGDWCLTKGNTFYADEQKIVRGQLPSVSELHTSTVQQIVEQVFDTDTGSCTVVIESDMMQPDFLAAAHGHRMNDCGVATSSIHGDIAFTLAEHIHKKLGVHGKDTRYNVANLQVTKALVARKNTANPQVIRVTASTTDVRSGIDLVWQNINANGDSAEPFATSSIHAGISTDWISSWSSLTHLVRDRIETLDRLVAEGKANRLSHNMAYTLFASNLVDYADKYRGMQSVVMHGLEGCADVELSTKESGVWTVPPYFIDSVAHLAGFIMNCSDAIDAKKFFCITPGWKTMRFARPLVPGARYQSYVKMIPTVEDDTAYFGDVYILQDGVIIGLVEGIEFHRYRRILLERLFSAPDSTNLDDTTETKDISSSTQHSVPVSRQVPPAAKSSAQTVFESSLPFAVPGPRKSTARPAVDEIAAREKPVASQSSSITNRAMQLIADEVGVELADLCDDVGFSDLGVDSLMSLVIADTFRATLDIKVNGSLFLDYETIGDLRNWLEETYA